MANLTKTPLIDWDYDDITKRDLRVPKVECTDGQDQIMKNMDYKKQIKEYDKLYFK